MHAAGFLGPRLDRCRIGLDDDGCIRSGRRAERIRPDESDNDSPDNDQGWQDASHAVSLAPNREATHGAGMTAQTAE